LALFEGMRIPEDVSFVDAAIASYLFDENKKSMNNINIFYLFIKA
jgi:hypothetical protein